MKTPLPFPMIPARPTPTPSSVPTIAPEKMDGTKYASKVNSKDSDNSSKSFEHYLKQTREKANKPKESASTDNTNAVALQNINTPPEPVKTPDASGARMENKKEDVSTSAMDDEPVVTDENSSPAENPVFESSANLIAAGINILQAPPTQATLSTPKTGNLLKADSEKNSQAQSNPQLLKTISPDLSKIPNPSLVETNTPEIPLSQKMETPLEESVKIQEIQSDPQLLKAFQPKLSDIKEKPLEAPTSGLKGTALLDPVKDSSLNTILSNLLDSEKSSDSPIQKQVLPIFTDLEDFKPSEKIADPTASIGKKLSPRSESILSNSLSTLLSEVKNAAFAEKMDSIQTKVKNLSLSGLGIENAQEGSMQGTLEKTALSEESGKAVNPALFTSSSTALTNMKATQQPESVRLSTLAERVRQIAENQPPPAPRHVAFEVEPPSLGRINVDLHWTAEGWNVNWAVTHNEVRDWLVQQLPTLQQNQSQTPMVWHAPTLQNSGWDASQQQRAHSQKASDGSPFLADEDLHEENETASKTKEFWA